MNPVPPRAIVWSKHECNFRKSTSGFSAWTFAPMSHYTFSGVGTDYTGVFYTAASPLVAYADYYGLLSTWAMYYLQYRIVEIEYVFKMVFNTTISAHVGIVPIWNTTAPTTWEQVRQHPSAKAKIISTTASTRRFYEMRYKLKPWDMRGYAMDDQFDNFYGSCAGAVFGDPAVLYNGGSPLRLYFVIQGDNYLNTDAVVQVDVECAAYVKTEFKSRIDQANYQKWNSAPGNFDWYGGIRDVIFQKEGVQDMEITPAPTKVNIVPTPMSPRRK